jgi:ATP-dependent DNA helicase RecG
MNFATPIEKIPKIGPVFQKKLKKIGIKTVEDLLFHFPHRYEDFSNIKPISKIKLNEQVCVSGKILEITTSRTWKKKMFLTEAVVVDKTGAVKVVWFNQPYLKNVLKSGDTVYLAGKAVWGEKGVYLSNPAFEKAHSNAGKTIHTGRIIPVYPETEGLSSRWLRYIIYPLLKELKESIEETLPESIVKEQNLLPRKEALQQAHFPDSMELAEKAKERFSFEELFVIELAVLRERLKLNKEKAPAIPINVELIRKFVKGLPFKLTNAQRKCAWQILKDMETTQPMSRLLQGDVGSGKTMVAIIPSLNAVKADYQVAFMAPTEILAKQHFKTISELLKPFKIRVALLTGKEDKIVSLKLDNETIEISRNKLLERTRKGEIDILVGTHTLIQEKVNFHKLALAVVDEQHRFGVEQRAKLLEGQKQQGKNYTVPHFLSMTATPIPRSLALTLYGDLDISILDEMPKGRKKVITKIIPPQEREKTYQFIRERIKRGEQAFVICPRIESSEDTEYTLELEYVKEKKTEKKSSWSETKAVKEEYHRLSKEVFPDLKVAMVHGKMKPKEKEKTMKDFKLRKIDILVSTSVVEVGIDIPKATVIMIEGAERFGLAQLHQFRGRVGRSNLQSYCFLLTDSNSRKTRERLRALVKTESGFELSQKDLELRGPGSLTGVKQWGIPDIAMEGLRNIALVEKAREAAKTILRSDPALKNYPFLQEKLKKFNQKIHLE